MKWDTISVSDTMTVIRLPPFIYFSYKIHIVHIHWKKLKFLVWKLFKPLLEVKWILIFHNNCIFPYHGKCVEIPGILERSIQLNSENSFLYFCYYRLRSTAQKILLIIFNIYSMIFIYISIILSRTTTGMIGYVHWDKFQLRNRISPFSEPSE